MSADGSHAVEISVIGGMGEVDAASWDACACPEVSDGGRPHDPFTTHAFLLALEESGSATSRAGWAPHHLVARLEGEVIGAMPLYLKSHSQGEFVFDHAWAHAWERAGGDYYPKLQAAVPFTPATGRRFLTRPVPGLAESAIQAALIDGATQLCARHGLSSLHITFCTEAEWQLGGEVGLLQRTDQQFHWENRDYPSFEAFLDDLASRKRKNLRKERARAVENGITL
ncbi:MAG: peptidogalycan biosysnthesis protein, partial [Pseudomonadota bacterium]